MFAASPQRRSKPTTSPCWRSGGSTRLLTHGDFDSTILRLRHLVAGRHQQIELAAAGDRDCVRIEAISPQRGSDHGGAIEGQSLVVGEVAERVGMTDHLHLVSRPAL